MRVETGYQDRDQYKIAVLYDPSKPWTAWEPQDGWNHKLLINHGASCGIDHQSGSAPDVENDAALSRGFAVMSTALNNAGHNCNIVTQAESMVMAKERLVEQYGEIRYTIGTGCSGGSLTQQQVANAYPGIYQGILPACSFPDSWSTGQQLVDYHLVRNYVENPAKWGTGVAWTPDAIAAVEGHPNHVNSIVFDTVYWTSLGVPDDGCPGVPAEQNYNAQTNPGGVRCTLADYMINVFGPRPSSVWSPAEQQVGHGFAGLPLDNVGVQYGLEALKKGQITTEQFVDLNDKIGGGTIDSVWTPERFKADQPALANAYKSGGDQQRQQPRQGRDHRPARPGPGRVPRRLPLVGDPCTARARARHVRQPGDLVRRGAADGRPATTRTRPWSRWTGGSPPSRPTTAAARWRRRSSATVRATSRTAARRSTSSSRSRFPGIGKVCNLKDVQTRYGTPHTVAGEGIETDINKCTLKPLRRSDYYPIAFSDDQWARLQSAFPTGVCDWGTAGRQPDGRDPVADLPGQRGQRRVRRAAARPGAVERRAPAGPATRSAPGATDQQARPPGAALEWAAPGAVVQLVERWSPKPEVEGSNPSCPAGFHPSDRPTASRAAARSSPKYVHSTGLPSRNVHTFQT